MDDFQPKPFGKYFLIDKLATGGMAEIYKAKTFGVDGFEKQLAIKRILPHCSADKEFIGMLIDEAKLSVLLSHTNIVQVYDLGKVGDDYFISMEFINGSNLREVLTRGKELGETFSEDIIVYIISEVCKGLDYAHAKKDNDGNPLNIVHRDVSPQNILLSFEGEVKIVDFGIAKAAMNISQTMAGILKGKISYMSPEQALGKPIDRKTDIYSAGLILYELLKGEKLFTGETQLEVLKKIRTTRLTEKSFPETISLPLRKILAKALAYSTKERYDSAGDFQIDLTRYLYSTYVDFTPRKLSKVMLKLFAEEIESKKGRKKEEISIDAKTRSFIIGQTEQKNIVHRGGIEATAGTLGKQPTATYAEGLAPGEEVLEKTRTGEALEGLEARYPATAVKKKWGRYVGSAVTLLLLIGGGLLTYYKTNLFQRTPLTPLITGTLQISSNPEGAEIFINDSETSLLTPASIEKLEIGKLQRITLKKEKFKDWNKAVTLLDPNPVSLNPNLEIIPTGSIKVKTTPPGAKIFLDGQDTGKVSPITLEDLPLSKTYSLKLDLEKYRPIEERITVYSIEPLDFTKKLEEIQYGSLKVASTPPGARVYLNNSDTGANTPTVIDNLEVGKSYTVRLRRDGYSDTSSSVTISEKKTYAISQTLKKADEKTPEQLAQEKAQQEAEKLKQQEVDKLKQQEAEKQKQQEAQKTATETPQEKKKETEKEKSQVEPTSTDSFVALSSDPKGADVFINGARVGSSPGRFKVATGTPVEVTISKTGFSTVTKVVTLRPGETRSLGNISLGGSSAEGAGIILVDSNPPGAMVFLNGAPQKATPLRIKGLRPQSTNTITVKKDGYQDWTTSFTVGEGAKSFMANLKQN